MRSIEWSFYDAQTGVLAPVCSLLPEGADPLGFAPPGCVPFAGRLNPHTQRIDLQTGQVVPYRPPAPPADELRDWAWSDEAERWLPVPTLAARKAALRAPLLQELAAADARAIRPMLEVLAALADGTEVSATAAAVLVEIKGHKQVLRTALQSVDTAATEADLVALQAPPLAGERT